ncbi:uncharacterized protein LOC142180753 [Nicotiana tabacum]|uniref:Uncharacterized protein LOC142180753 n=1 Tax=Nicotiana tabacum TaxID=4097 RepID=A0AC58UHE6_TOBAC
MGSVLTIEIQVDLLKSYNAKEVKEIIFQIDSSKRPSLHDFGSGFFKAAWSIVGEDIIATILEFSHNGKLLKQLNSTNIVLIPNVEVPEYTSQYSPIFCCNVVYKGISKMLCSRLKHVVTQLEADNQAAFIPDRFMMHNILICHDLLRHYNKKLLLDV